MESGEFGEDFKASVYFNSLMSRIDNEQSPELLDTFKTYLNSEAFYEHDLRFKDRLARNPQAGYCNGQCDDRCHVSWLKWDKEATKA